MAAQAAPVSPAPTQPPMPRPELAQHNPPFKKMTDLKYEDANFHPVRQLITTSAHLLIPLTII
jgi:hypothetical protein